MNLQEFEQRKYGSTYSSFILLLEDQTRSLYRTFAIHSSPPGKAFTLRRSRLTNGRNFRGFPIRCFISLNQQTRSRWTSPYLGYPVTLALISLQSESMRLVCSPATFLAWPGQSLHHFLMWSSPGLPDVHSIPSTSFNFCTDISNCSSNRRCDAAQHVSPIRFKHCSGFRW
jgi:hypothetical protein